MSRRKDRRPRHVRARDLVALIMELLEHRESDNGRRFQIRTRMGRRAAGDLIKYTQGDAFKKLSAEDQELIVQQASALNSYFEVIKIRAKK